MSEFFKNKKQFTMMLSALLLVITLATGSFAVVSGGEIPVSSKERETSGQEEADPQPEEPEEPAEEEEVVAVAASYNKPDEMLGAYLVPGSDFFKAKDATEKTVQQEIDAAFDSAKKLNINSVIVDTVYDGQVIYHTEDADTLSDFDALAYIVNKSRQQGFYTYAIFDASPYTSGDAGAKLDKLSAGLDEFAIKYQLDGILLDGYTEPTATASYSDYSSSGAAMGFDNFVRQSPAALVKTAAQTIHNASPSTQVGLLADAVWANKTDNDKGSATQATFTSLGSGNADTKGFVERGYVDFVAVKAFSSTDSKDEPFDEVVSWWSDVAKASGMPLYVVHASDKSAGDQLLKQVDLVEKAQVQGSIFNNLQPLSANASLVKYLNGGTMPEIAPTPAVVASAPAPKPAAPAPAPAPAPTPPSESDDDLVGEFDNFTDDPDDADTDSMFTPDDDFIPDDYAEGGTSQSSGSDSWADTSEAGNSWDWDTDFLRVRTGSALPFSMTVPTGTTLLNAGSTTISDGDTIQVTSPQAIVYPPKTKDNVPSSLYYTLPRGTQDKVVGKPFSYTKANSKGVKVTYRYYTLASGLRVDANDIKAVSGSAPTGNSISDMAVTTDKNYTYITLRTSKRIPYAVKYTSKSISFQFRNTTKTPEDKSLSQNPLFTEAQWDNNILTLSLVKADGFMGYRAYYNKNGHLILRFNNPPKSISGARIAVDAGHGGRDTGVVGSDPAFPEKVINAQIADYLVAELEDRGATVLLLNSDNIEGQQRKELAEEWNAQLFVSVHSNSSPNNAKATGTEVYYFHPYSRNLATVTSKLVSGKLDTENRGPKPSYYHITLSPQMQSVLVETGFVTNAAEYKKLCNPKYQELIAQGIADGLEESIKATYTGITASGGSVSSSENSSSTSSRNDDVELEGISMRDAISINKNKTATLAVEFYPADTTYNGDLTWKSSKTSVATVDSNGKVKAISEGNCRITATTKDGEHSTICEVTVRSANASQVLATSVELEDPDVILSVKESKMLYATVLPEYADDTSVTWRSSRSSVATISPSGRVTGVKEGETVITATLNNGTKRDTCTVYVQGSSGTGSSANVSTEDSGAALNGVRDVSFDFDEVTVYPGSPVRLEIVSNTSELIRGKDFKWVSEDTSIVTVDDKGFVTGKKVGEAYVNASAKGFELSCLVVVSRDKIKVSSIDINKDKITLARKGTYKLEATIYPSSASNRVVVWTSENSKIAKVDSTGTVTALATGTTKITVRSKDGDYRATCEVVVQANAVRIEDIYIQEDLELFVGEKDKLVPDFEPSDATNQDVTYTSSNEAVVTVDKDGNIKAIKRGTARITVTSKDRASVKAVCQVKVLED